MVGVTQYFLNAVNKALAQRKVKWLIMKLAIDLFKNSSQAFILTRNFGNNKIAEPLQLMVVKIFGKQLEVFIK